MAESLTAKPSKLLEGLFRQNGTDIGTPHVNAFDISNLLRVGNGIMEAVDFLDDNLKAYFDPGGEFIEEKKREDKEREFQLRGIVGNNLRQRLDRIDDELEAGLERISTAAREKLDAIRREHLERERESGQRERDNLNDKIKTNVKPRTDFKKAHGDYETVGSTVKHVLDNPRDVAGDVVEAVAGKDVRQFGGHVLRGEFDKATRKAGDGVEAVAGKDVRSFGGHVLRGEFGAAANQVGTGISNTAAAAADTAIAAKDSVVKTVSGWLPSWGK